MGEAGTARFDAVVWEWGRRSGLEHLQRASGREGTKAKALVILDDEREVVRFRYSMYTEADGTLRRCFVFAAPRRGPSESKDSPWRQISLRSASAGGWIVDEHPRPDLDGCRVFDIADAAFPKTTIIKTLALAPGTSRTMSVALVDNRQLGVRAVQQEWTRLPDRDACSCYSCTDRRALVEYRFARDGLVAGRSGTWRRRSMGWPNPEAAGPPAPPVSGLRATVAAVFRRGRTKNSGDA